MSTDPETRRKRRVSYAEAADILASRDPVVAGLIAAGGPIRISRRRAAHFAALVEGIVYQQLAGAAARAIHGRLVLVLHDNVEPEALPGTGVIGAWRGRAQSGAMAWSFRRSGWFLLLVRLAVAPMN